MVSYKSIIGKESCERFGIGINVSKEWEILYSEKSERYGVTMKVQKE